MNLVFKRNVLDLHRYLLNFQLSKTLEEILHFLSENSEFPTVVSHKVNLGIYSAETKKERNNNDKIFLYAHCSDNG